MKLFIFSATSEETRMEGSINSVIAAGASEAAARTATLLAAKTNGGFDPAKFGAWSSYEIADGTVTLPGSSPAQFFGKCHGNGINSMPGV